jgi:hypothetical protein
MGNLDPRQGDSYGVPSGRPPAGRLTNAQLGYPTPSEPGLVRDQLNSGPSPMSIRHQAAEEARRMVQDNKGLLVVAETIAAGFRKGQRLCDGGTIDPNLLDGNTRAIPVNIQGKFVITPANPTAAVIASAALIAQANFGPGVYPAVPFTDDLNADYQTGIINGIGATIRIPVGPSEILVVDTIGITTFSKIAEFELAWTLGYGFSQPAQDGPFNMGVQMIQARHGWPFGTVNFPAKIHGKARFAPQQGPKRPADPTAASVVLAVRDLGLTTATYAPQPHYVDIALRGWKVIVGGWGDAEGIVLGGPICDPEDSGRMQ